MRDLFIPMLALLAMGALVYAIIGDAACNPPIEAPDAAPAPIRDAAPAPPDAVFRLEPPPPDAAPTELSPEVIARRGFIGIPEEWVGRMMDDLPRWTHDPRSPAPTYVADNGVRVSFKIRGGRVQSVGAELPEGTLSADVTALSGFVVGTHDALPLHVEVHRPDERVQTRGSFEDRHGRLWYYRLEMPQGVEPPYTVRTIEFAAEPFPGQPRGLNPPPPPPGFAQPEPEPSEPGQ